MQQIGHQTLEQITLSVVIPVYNDADNLKRSLAALAASHYDHFDVLVIDDGSTTPVAPLVRTHGFDYLRLASNGGPARARNYGALHTNGTYLVFIDADVCVHRETLARFAQTFAADSTIDAVVGTYDETPAAPNFLSQYKNLLHHYVHHSNHGEIGTFWSGCGAIRRTTFLSSGGFDAQRYRRPAIEDIELGTWLSASGHRIVLNRSIQATHLKRWTLGTLFKTDIWDRGIPWVRLMLRAKTIATTLNVKPIQRLCVILVYMLVALTLATVWWPICSTGVALIALALVIINHPFYRYLTTRVGFWFTLRVVPLHWFYFGYCGLCIPWGMLLHYLEDVHPTPAPQARPINIHLR